MDSEVHLLQASHGEVPPKAVEAPVFWGISPQLFSGSLFLFFFGGCPTKLVFPPKKGFPSFSGVTA